MNKKAISVFAVFMLIFYIFSNVLTLKVQAYQNASYSSDIKVGLVSMSSSTLSVTLNGGYNLNGTPLPSGTILNMSISNGSVNVNGTNYVTVSLVPQIKGTVIAVSNGSRSYNYLGSFTFSVSSNVILPINIINIEDYLKGVVSLEMSEAFPAEALKAQAVAARNYALSRIGYCSSKGYDFDDTTNYQTYWGYNPSYVNSIAAVNATKGQVLLYNDSLVETLYSASDGGYTENSVNVWGNASPYLLSKPDSYDSQVWPNGNRVLTNAQIESILKSKGYLQATDSFLSLDLNSITRYISGRVSNINVIYKDALGNTLTKSFQMDKTRTFLGLPSSLYTVTYDSTALSYTFSGMGNGHGLGMSQIGAKNRALAGQTYDQILKFYYDGTYLQNLIQTAYISGFTISKNQILLGDTLAFNGTAQSGSGQGLSYKYVVSKDGSVIFTKDYDGTSSINYTPSTSGNYIATLYVKDNASTNVYDDSSSLNFSVFNPPALSSFKIDKTQALIGQTVTLTSQGINGSSSYLYKYVVSNNGAVMYTRDFASNSTFIYTVGAAGNYTVTVYLKDAVSSKAYDVTQSLGFTGYTSPSISYETASGTMFQGKMVALSTYIANGTPSRTTYRYEVYKSGILYAVRDYSSDFTYNFTPSTAASYTVKVYVKDSLSTKAYDAYKQFNISISALPLSVSKLPIYYGMKGTDVTTIQNALNKLGFSVGTADGIYGSKTYTSVINFQKSKSINATGTVDTVTFNALNNALINQSGTKTLYF